jgi:hypothetical protein
MKGWQSRPKLKAMVRRRLRLLYIFWPTPTALNPSQNNAHAELNGGTLSTARATVGVNSFASVHDPLVQELEEYERDRHEHITWLTKRSPGRDFSTLDLEELKQLRREFGPEPTLEQDHVRYPNVRSQ